MEFAPAERLNAQHVVKEFAYWEKRWPGTRPAPGSIKITRIRWTWFDEEMEEKAERARQNMLARLVEREPERYPPHLA